MREAVEFLRFFEIEGKHDNNEESDVVDGFFFDKK